MLKSAIIGSVLGTGLLIGGTALAADVEMPAYEQWTADYVGAFGGVVLGHPDNGVHYDVDTGRVRFDTGFEFGLVYGSHISHDLRADIELVYQQFNGRSLQEASDDTVFDLDGEIRSFSILANLWKDFDTGTPFRPYLGLGAGFTVVDHDLAYTDDDTPDPVDSTDIAPTAQIGAGIRTDYNGLIFDLGYRYKASWDIFGDSSVIASGADSAALNLNTHSIRAGVSYYLNGDGTMPVPDGPGAPYYVGANAGVIFSHDNPLHEDNDGGHFVDFDNSFAVSGVFGTHLVPGLRGELELAYSHQDADDYETTDGSPPVETIDGVGDVSQLLLLMNVWKDVNIGPIRPYIGGGLGVAFLDFELVRGDVNSNIFFLDDQAVGFAGQLGAGVRWQIGDGWMADVGYRYRGVLKAFLFGNEVNSESAIATFMGHVVQGGVTYHLSGDNPAEWDAPADSRDYLALHAGFVFGAEATIQNDDNTDLQLENGFSVSGVYGTHITDGLRGEIEIVYEHTDPDKSREDGINQPFQDASGDHSNTFAFLNLWKDVSMTPSTDFYFGGGLGLGLLHVDMTVPVRSISAFDSTELAFAYQAGGGIRWGVQDGMHVDLGYRFRSLIDGGMRPDETPETTSFEFGSGTYESHTVQVGIAIDLAD